MMNDFFNRTNRLFAYGEHLHPTRDWLVLVILALLALAVSVVSNVWFFDRVANGGTLGGSGVPSATVFQVTSLESVKHVFEVRSAEETKYRNGSYTFSDPSK